MKTINLIVGWIALLVLLFWLTMSQTTTLQQLIEQNIQPH